MKLDLFETYLRSLGNFVKYPRSQIQANFFQKVMEMFNKYLIVYGAENDNARNMTFAFDSLCFDFAETMPSGSTPLDLALPGTENSWKFR